jgi:hypothetical protein
LLGGQSPEGAALRGDAPAARERLDEALAARAMGALPWIERIEGDRERSAPVDLQRRSIICLCSASFT